VPEGVVDQLEDPAVATPCPPDISGGVHVVAFGDVFVAIVGCRGLSPERCSCSDRVGWWLTGKQEQ
jgi:hypothetical protein